jgi:hypothetical protein
MKMSELEFNLIDVEPTSNLELVDEFLENNEPPVMSGRIYTGALGNHGDLFPHTFGLRETLPPTEKLVGNDNALLGFEEDWLADL